ncbi:MAG TPA: hypothetical protein VEW28_10530 [Candidatus Kapabacteria bacterium]|nr:hypothetical protein [Candidatus Kapabacteria bacterium]
MIDIHVNDPNDFTSYPNNRICAVIDDRDDAQRTVDALLGSGIDAEYVDILYGKSGADVLDADSTHVSVLTRLARKLRSFGDVENESMHIYESALHHGGYVFAVPAKSDDEKESIRKVLAAGNAREINYFSTWYVQAMRANS